MLKPICTCLLTCLALLGLPAMAQKNIGEGVIKYEEVFEPGTRVKTELSIFINQPIEFSFSDKMFKMYRFSFTSVTTYKPSGNPAAGFIVHSGVVSETVIYTEPYEEDYAKAMDGIDIGKFKNISYDKRDTKTILGYPCYRANLTLADGSSQVYYITEKINAPGYKHQGQTESIAGYPLEIQLVDEDKTSRLYKAIEITTGLQAGAFSLPTWNMVKKPKHAKAAAPEVQQRSPDHFDNYMGYKLGTKKSDYPKEGFSPYVAKELFGIEAEKFERFFENEVHRSYVMVKNRKIVEVNIELSRYKETENNALLIKYINTILPLMETTLGEYSTEEKDDGKTLICTWKGEKIQVALYLGVGMAPTILGSGLPYFKRMITLKYL